MLTQFKIDQILAKKPESRYKYFVRTAAAEEEVWGLADEEGWLLLEVEEDDTEALAVFPNPEFAAIFREKGDFTEFTVEPLDLAEFMEWLEDFEKEKIKVAVFPTPDFQSAVMSAERLREDFLAEFEKEHE